MESNEIMVSIVCNTYNHEKYIEDALEGFVNQKTNFPFEVLVMDDASTDGTADIIREYEKKYPDLIKPIYQTVNQYSQGLRPGKQNRDRATGKYLAYCEGDDYWIDDHKLQKQVDFLENHPNYSMCLHCVKVCDLTKNDKEDNSNNFIPANLKCDSTIQAGDIIVGKLWFQTSSFVLKTSLLKKGVPSCFISKGNGGDYLYLIRGVMEGSVYYMADVMSVYRKGVDGSWTLRLQKDKNAFIKNSLLNIESLQEIRKYYRGKNWMAFTIAIYRQKCRLLKYAEYPTNNLLVKLICFLDRIFKGKK